MWKVKDRFSSFIKNNLSHSLTIFFAGIGVGVGTNMVANLVVFEGNLFNFLFYLLAAYFYLLGGVYLAVGGEKIRRYSGEMEKAETSIVRYIFSSILFYVFALVCSIIAAVFNFL